MNETSEVVWRVATLAIAVGIAGTSCLLPLKRGWTPLSLATHLLVVCLGVIAGNLAGGGVAYTIAHRASRGEFMAGVAVAFGMLAGALLGGFAGGCAALMVVRVTRARPIFSWRSLGMAFLSYYGWFLLASSLSLLDAVDNWGGFRGRMAPLGLLAALLLLASLMLAGEAVGDAPRAQSRAPARLPGSRLFWAWVLVGIGGRLVDLVMARRSLSPIGFAGTTLAQGWLLQRALGQPIVWPWALATVVGALLGAWLGAFASSDMPFEPAGPSLLVSSLVFGAVVGLAQWVVLRPSAPRAWIWIPATTLAILCPGLLATYVHALPSWGGALPGPILSGAALLLILPRYSSTRGSSSRGRSDEGARAR